MTKIENEAGHNGLYIEVADTKLDFRPVAVSDATPTGDQILALCDAAPRDDYVVLQWLESGDVDEVRRDETISLKGSVPARFIVAKTDRLFRLVVDEHSISWPNNKIRAASLRELGKVDAKAELYLRRDGDGDLQIGDDAIVSLSDLGVEHFYSKRADWKLNVQGVIITSTEPTITVRDALKKAGFDPDQGWIIVLKTSEAKKQVTLDDVVDLRSPGIEKLRLTPREINNGEAEEVLRRDFKLLPVDERGLEARGLIFETLIEGSRRWLILPNYPLPEGFSSRSASIALEIPPPYPAAEIDMFYCLPHLARVDGRPIPQTEARVSIRGQSFQRWSRHRGPGAQWRPQTDNVLTHLALVDAAILREVEQ